MAGKIANKADTGRCGRCCLSYGNEIKQCFRYGNACNRVAWNCGAPSRGFVRSEINDEALAELDSMTVPNVEVSEGENGK